MKEINNNGREEALKEALNCIRHHEELGASFEANQFKKAYRILDRMIKAYNLLSRDVEHSVEAELALQAIVQGLLFVLNNPAGLDEEFLVFFYALPRTVQINLTQDQRFRQGAQNLIAILSSQRHNSESIRWLQENFSR